MTKCLARRKFCCVFNDITDNACHYETDKIAKIDGAAEKQLKQRRQKKVNKVRLFSTDDISGVNRSAVKNAYRRDDDKTAFMEPVKHAKSLDFQINKT